MKVTVANSAGFCWGVSRAVAKARSLVAEATTDPVYTDGPLIHNEQMMGQLRREGVVECENPDTLRDDTLLIRAHGIPPSRRDMLTELPVRLVDATCPDVAKIQGLIRKHARRGSHIVIFGDAGHAEVTGLLGFAEGRGFVVGSVEDVNRLPALQHVCLVSQSTQFTSSYDRIAQAVVHRFPDTEILDTICKSTKHRQADLVAMAATVDAFVVVGSSHSANTLRLVELARDLRPTFHIQTGDQIRPEDFENIGTVGLTAGASTPRFIIEDVRRILEAI